MRISRKPIAAILALAFVFTMFMSGCGKKEADVSTIDTGTQNADTVKADDTSKDSGKVDLSTGVKKKIVIVMEDDFADRVKAKENFLNTLKEKAGLDSNNAEITELDMKNNEKKAPEFVEKIKNIRPDVVVDFQVSITNIAKPLENSGIPVLVYVGAESFVDANGKPKDNITGIYTMKSDLRYNAFMMLNKISPLKGKKAVFVTVDGFFNKNDIEKDLNKVGVQLKAYCESKYAEDFMTAINKYNSDDEVGWILVGVWPTTRKDGTPWDMNKMAKWDIENRKKPSVTYWDIAVSMGMLCGLGVDLTDTGNQLGDMTIKILSGEKVQNINAEEPRKTSIVLNQKRAEQLGITFPVDVLGSAKVYTDFEGHYKK